MVRTSAVFVLVEMHQVGSGQVTDDTLTNRVRRRIGSREILSHDRKSIFLPDPNVCRERQRGRLAVVVPIITEPGVYMTLITRSAHNTILDYDTRIGI